MKILHVLRIHKIKWRHWLLLALFLDVYKRQMENDASGKFHNYCFEIDLGTDATYTYKIQKGVARNQNATFLLNKILEKY